MPLVYLRDGDSYVVMASNAGTAERPGWQHNLEAHPGASVQVGSRKFAAHGRRATSEERERLWERVVALYHEYGAYANRTAPEIALIVLATARTNRVRSSV